MAKLSMEQWNELIELRDHLYAALVTEYRRVLPSEAEFDSPLDWDEIELDAALYAGTTVAHIHADEATKSTTQAQLIESAKGVGQLLAQGKTFEEAVSAGDTRFCLAKE